MKLQQIRLELARTKDHPQGDPNHYFIFKAPLTPDGHLDANEFKTVADLCTVTRSVPDEPVEHGLLIQNRQGWAFSYEVGDDDDEPIFRLGSHLFKVGEYVTITEHDEEPRTFRVSAVSEYHPTPA